MNGAVYILFFNVCVALLFASAFAVIAMTYRAQRGAVWFSAVYFVGMLTPLSELAVHFADWPRVFAASSFGSFLVSVLLMPIGLAAISGRPVPWRTALGILIWGIMARIAIWDSPRDVLRFEMIYQSAFIAGALLSWWVAFCVARRSGGKLWWALVAVFSLIVLHFATKPFFAVGFGSGVDDKAYTSSTYALFSQATGGVLIVTAGLQIMLIVLATAIGRTTLESETDALTTIANRRGFDRRAATKIAEAQQYGSPLALALFDLDHFKQINDSYGHSTGDIVIRTFADLLRKTLPPSAVIARIGGEEFVALLERTTLLGAWQAAQAIRAALPGIGANMPVVTVSGGIAELRRGDTLSSLLDRADKGTYEAKAAGRDRICPPPATEPAGVHMIGKRGEA